VNGEFQAAILVPSTPSTNRIRWMTLGRANAKLEFSENHRISERLFGLVVGALNIGVFVESKKAMVFLMGVEQSLCPHLQCN